MLSRRAVLGSSNAPARRASLIVTATYLFLALLGWAPPGPGEPDAPESDLVIVSESDCPSSDAVRQALAKLRPATEWPEAVVALRLADQTLSIDIGAEDPIQRRLAVGPDCSERASSAALVIATWMDDLPAEASGVPLLRAAALAKPTAPAPASVRYEIGAALAAATGAGWTPAAQLELIGLREGRHFGWQAAVGRVAPRGISVGSGVSHWLRNRSRSRRRLHGRLGLWLRPERQRWILHLGNGGGRACRHLLGPNSSMDGSALAMVAQGRQRPDRLGVARWSGQRPASIEGNAMVAGPELCPAMMASDRHRRDLGRADHGRPCARSEARL